MEHFGIVSPGDKYSIFILDLFLIVVYFKNQVSTCISASNAQRFVTSRECAVIFPSVVVDSTLLILMLLEQ